VSFRTDVSIDFTLSPRVITVASPSVSITIQDLYDTVASIQQQMFNLIYVAIVDANTGGKQVLGGGVLVGVTLSLRNALLAFAARPGPATVQCSVTGGNLVAVDVNGASLTTPIQPTAFTQVVVAQSTSAALIQGPKGITLGQFLALTP
jgi:hypothetical protein